jgi:uncharacterized protein (UPF0332 family)
MSSSGNIMTIINFDDIYDREYCKSMYTYFLKKKIITRTDSRNFRKYSEKAVANLLFSNFIFEEHNNSIKKRFPEKTFYDWCITIDYYAIYHISLALLCKLGLTSKNHSATIIAIALFYHHKDKMLRKEDIDFLIDKINIDDKDIHFVIDSKKLRETACYNVDETLEYREAKILQSKTSDFIYKILGEINK